MDGSQHRIIDDLYAGTLDQQAWDRAMLGVRDLVGASGAALLVFRPDIGVVLRAEGYGLEPGLLREYLLRWAHHDVRLKYALHVPVGAPMTEQTLNIPDWDRAPLLNEFLDPAGIPHSMRAWLKKTPSRATTLSLQATRKQGPFGRRAMELYRALLPDLIRALEIRDRLELAAVTASTLSAALECTRFGLLVLDASGKLIESNQLARKIMARSASVIHRQRDGTLWLAEPASATLEEWIATGTPPRRQADALLRLPRPNRTALSLLLTASPRHLPCWISSEPRLLLFLFDPELRLPADVALIGKELGISRSEAEVCALLLRSESLHSIAKRRRVSLHTVRAQLKSVFKKTGIASQVELVRRIALGPASHLDR